MKESTQQMCDSLIQGLVSASDGDMDARYNIAVFLRDVSENTTNYSPEEAAECIERFKFSQSTASRWTRVAHYIGREELASLKGIRGATAEITFTWSHIVILASVTNNKLRAKLVKEWKKADEADQSVRAFEKKVKNLVTPPAEPGTSTMSPKRAFSKLTSVCKNMAEFLELVQDVDLAEPAEDAPDTTNLLRESLGYIWVTVPTIAASLGINLETLGDVVADDDDIADHDDGDDDDEDVDDDQDDGTGEDPDDSDDSGEDDNENSEVTVEEQTPAGESKGVLKKPVSKGRGKGAGKSEAAAKNVSHKSPAEAKPVSLADADTSAARGRGPSSNRRRGAAAEPQ